MKNYKKIITAGLLILGLAAGPAFADESQFDKFGGWKGLKGTKTGAFHVEELNGRWWIITPAGHVFWSTGVYSVRFSGIPDNETGKRPYQEACKEKYGSVSEWARVTRWRLKEWGFNTVGDWSSQEIYREPGFAYVIGIDLPKSAYNIIPEGYYGYFPDVFSKEFQDSVTAQIEQRFQQQPFLIDDPWLLGYFLADEPAWYGSKQRRGALTDDYIRLDADKAGKQKWVEFAKLLYKDVRDLNSAWDLNIRNFDELLDVKEIPDTERAKEDKLKFLKAVALQFSKVLFETLRAHDQHHMILGTRPARQYPEIMEAVGEYTDVFGISAYGLNEGYQISKNYEESVSGMYNLSKKPILLGFLLTAKDSGLPYGAVNTQRDRGISYWRYLGKIAADPRVVGVHWFQYFDPPEKCYDAMAANWGLVNGRDEPYTDAVQLIQQANRMVYAYALGLADFVPEFDGLFGLIKKAAPQAEQGPQKLINIPVRNNGFENKSAGWKLQTWKGNSRGAVDADMTHDGKYALRLTGGDGAGWDSVGVAVQDNPGIVLKPQYDYVLSGWVKTTDVPDFAFIRIKTTGEDGKETVYETEKAYGSGDWKKYEVKFSPRDAQTVSYLAAQLVGKGTAWFDDIRLEVLAPEQTDPRDFVAEEIKPATPVYQTVAVPLPDSGFEQGGQGWQFQTWKGRPAVGVDSGAAHTGKKSVKIKGAAEGWDSNGVAALPSPQVNFKAGKKYLLKGWMKASDVGHFAVIKIKIKYNDGKTGYVETESVNGTRDWTEFFKEFEVKGGGSVDYIACQLVGSGTAWFDDISLEEVAGP